MGKKDEIELGSASILTTLKDETVEEFSIEIIKLNDNTSKIKNILFNIVDERLIKITGGVIQGMSGSPILQNNKIIGAVTHVIVEDVKRGYGIYIENMLGETEN